MSESKLLELADKMVNNEDSVAYQTLIDCVLFKIDTEGNPAFYQNELHQLIETLKSNADAGSAISQALLGVLYLYGTDELPYDLAQGVKYAKKSAGLGNPMGEVALGYAYMLGKGVAQDEERGLYWFRMAETKNSPYAQNNLGWLYENGLAGIKMDKNAAARYYRSSADQDCTLGMYNLGRCYENGIGVSQDFSAALSWYQKSAKIGNPLSQGSLAKMLENGLGCEKNIPEAIKWYLRAGWSKRSDFLQYENALNRLAKTGHGELIEKMKEELNLS